MRVPLTITFAALLGMATAPGVAQNQVAAQDQKPAASANGQKAAQSKVCKRTHSGKVCMTAEQWKKYQEIM